MSSRAFKKAEIKAMLKAAQTTRDKLFIQAGYAFGLRISETLGLRLLDLQGQYIQIKSKKKSANATFPIPSEIRKLSRKLAKEYNQKGHSINADTPAFLGKKSRRSGMVKALSNRMGAYILAAIKESAKIKDKVTYHGLRKAFATLIYQETGKDPIQTMKYTRHKSLNSLIYYITVSEDLKLIRQITF